MTGPLQIDFPGDGIARITLDTPENMNAMTTVMGDALLEAVEQLDHNGDVRVIILTGSGKAFSAGGDLTMLERNTDLPAEVIEKEMRAFYGRFLVLRELSKPVIAAINGHAIGAGLCVALACDLRLAADGAKMGVNFARIGLSPGMGATWLLSRIVGVPRALDLLLTGRLVTGEEAASMGLVRDSVDRDQLEEKSLELARQIAANAPVAVSLIKRFVYNGFESSLDSALEREAFGQSVTFRTNDMKEGLKAIREKRSPEFSGS